MAWLECVRCDVVDITHEQERHTLQMTIETKTDNIQLWTTHDAALLVYIPKNDDIPSLCPYNSVDEALDALPTEDIGDYIPYATKEKQ